MEVNDWQWFEDYEQAALERGDDERARMRQIHREAFASREVDPDQALSLLAEGRRLALALQEPWWVLLFEHWQVHITLYCKSDYRNVLEPAVRNVLQIRKPQYADFPQKLWIVGDLINIYVVLDPRGFADEIEQALAELEAELTPQAVNARYLFMFHQLDAAANQDRLDDALQIALQILVKAQADPDQSTGDHYLVSCYRALCSFYKLRDEWSEVATWAQAGEAVARQLSQEAPLAIFLMWQAVLNQQQGEPGKAARFFRMATSRMGKLHCPPDPDYCNALCAYHELRGDLETSLRVRTEEIQAYVARGQAYDEYAARLAQLSLLVEMGRPVLQQLSEARAAVRKFRRPECYLPQIERIAAKAERSPGQG